MTSMTQSDYVPVRSELQEQRVAVIPWAKIRGVLFDWAGTTIDFGSLAPVEVVRTVFQGFGIDVSEQEARQPMGKAKIDHLREILAMPRIAAMWQEVHSVKADASTLAFLYERFLVLQKSILANHCDLIPGVIELVNYLRKSGIKIGSTTGYTRELMDVVLPIVARAGYQPDAVVCSDEVSAGRPAPWSNFRAAELLGLYPMDNIVIVDDSIAGIEAGKNAGCYSVAVTTTGNSFGKSLIDLQRLDQNDLVRRHQQAEAAFYAAGADLVVESVADLHKLWMQNTL